MSKTHKWIYKLFATALTFSMLLTFTSAMENSQKETYYTQYEEILGRLRIEYNLPQLKLLPIDYFNEDDMLVPSEWEKEMRVACEDWLAMQDSVQPKSTIGNHYAFVDERYRAVHPHKAFAASNVTFNFYVTLETTRNTFNTNYIFAYYGGAGVTVKTTSTLYDGYAENVSLKLGDGSRSVIVSADCYLTRNGVLWDYKNLSAYFTISTDDGSVTTSNY